MIDLAFDNQKSVRSVMCNLMSGTSFHYVSFVKVRFCLKNSSFLTQVIFGVSPSIDVVVCEAFVLLLFLSTIYVRRQVFTCNLPLLIKIKQLCSYNLTRQMLT